MSPCWKLHRYILLMTRAGDSRHLFHEFHHWLSCLYTEWPICIKWQFILCILLLLSTYNKVNAYKWGCSKIKQINKHAMWETILSFLRRFTSDCNTHKLSCEKNPKLVMTINFNPQLVVGFKFYAKNRF